MWYVLPGVVIENHVQTMLFRPHVVFDLIKSVDRGKHAIRVHVVFVIWLAWRLTPHR